MSSECGLAPAASKTSALVGGIQKDNASDWVVKNNIVPKTGGLQLQAAFPPFGFSLVVVSHVCLLFGRSFGFEDWRRLSIKVVCVVFRER